MILVGVDGGGTKTHALALDETGRVIGSGIGSRSNHRQAGFARTFAVLDQVCQQALQGRQADMIVFCLSDCDIESDHAQLIKGIAPLGLSKQFECYNDAFAALRAGSSRRYGVAVICGTGFNACGIAPDGRQAKLHSLGPLTGDWGGGYSLGEAAFGAVFRAEEGRGPATMLTQMLLDAMKMPNTDALTQLLIDGGVTSDRVAALSPLTLQAAALGDPVAQSIVLHQADEISTAALALLRRLDMLNIAVDVALAGGVMRGGGALMLPTIQQKILAANPLANVHRLSVPPVVGAALFAFDQLGIPAPSSDQITWPANDPVFESVMKVKTTDEA